MNLGLHTAILDGLSFEEVVDYAASVGFTSLEVCCWPVGKAVRRYAGVTHIDVNKLTPKKAKYYVDYAKAKGITIATLGYYPNPMSDDQAAGRAARNHIKKVIDAAAMMKVKTVTTFIGKDKTKSVEDNLKLMVKYWTPIVKYAKQKKVRIAIENCPMFYTHDEWPGGNNLASTPQVWREMFKLGDNIGLCFDPSHMVLLGMDVTRPVKDYPDRIFHVHFKDIAVDQDKVNEYGRFTYPALWHSPKLPGLGDVPFDEFVSALNGIGYKGSAVLEFEDRAFENSLEDTKQGIESAYRYLRTLI